MSLLVATHTPVILQMHYADRNHSSQDPKPETMRSYCLLDASGTVHEDNFVQAYTDAARRDGAGAFTLSCLNEGKITPLPDYVKQQTDVSRASATATCLVQALRDSDDLGATAVLKVVEKHDHAASALGERVEDLNQVYQAMYDNLTSLSCTLLAGSNYYERPTHAFRNAAARMCDRIEKVLTSLEMLSGEVKRELVMYEDIAHNERNGSVPFLMVFSSENTVMYRHETVEAANEHGTRLVREGVRLFDIQIGCVSRTEAVKWFTPANTERTAGWYGFVPHAADALGGATSWGAYGPHSSLEDAQRILPMLGYGVISYGYVADPDQLVVEEGEDAMSTTSAGAAHEQPCRHSTGADLTS